MNQLERDILKAHVKALKVEEKHDIVSIDGISGYIRRKSPDYVLVASNCFERHCWGNLQEILTDAETFIDNNMLRPAITPRW